MGTCIGALDTSIAKHQKLCRAIRAIGMGLLMSRRTRTAACSIATQVLEGASQSPASSIDLREPSVGLVWTGSMDVDPLGWPRVRRDVTNLELAPLVRITEFSFEDSQRLAQ
jgi:hypothetical protein